MNELIHFHVFSPDRSLFKSSRNDKAETFLVYCSNKDNCSLHPKGLCVQRNSFGCSCPYGKNGGSTGYTKRAGRYYSWIRDQKERHKDVGSLSSPPNKIAFIGDYIYLPYSFMNMNEKIPFLSSGGGFRTGSDFMLMSDFVKKETIESILAFRPMAMMGGEIKDYQKKHIPLFKLHLKEVMPDIYDELIGEEIDISANVGRRAFVSSLKNGVEIKSTDGLFVVNDGWLETKKGKLILPFVKSEIIEIRLKPKPSETIEITDISQIDENTKYKD